MHIFFKRAVFCLLATALLAWNACARSETLEAGRWHDRADPVYHHVQLPPATLVTSMAQSSEGTLWLGSQEGLLRWDGYRFQKFTADPDVPGTLPDNVVTLLHRDTQGRVWVGTSSAGLARVDERTGRFETISTGPHGLSRDDIHAAADDGSGGLWVGTGAGLDHLAADGVTVDRRAPEQHAAGLPDCSVMSLLLDGSGTLWVGTHSGLYRRAAGSNRFEPVWLDTGEEADPIIASLMADSTGRLWIGTRGHGAFTIAAGTAQASPVHDTQNAGASGLASDTVLSALEVTDGEVWLGTTESGIVRVDTRRWVTYRVRHHDTLTTSLADDDVFVLFRDRSGLTWVATTTDLSSCDTTQLTVSTWLGYAGNDDGISQSDVPAVLAVAGDTLWVGLGDGGVDIVEPGGGLVRRLHPDPAHPATSLPKQRVLAMVAASDGAVWLGTQQGLYRAASDGHAVERVDVPGRKATSSTWALHVDGERLWLGGLDGLWGIEFSAQGRPRLVARYDTSTLKEQRVTSLSPGLDRTLWIGTRTGLAHLDLRSGQIDIPALDQPGKIGLPRGWITSVRTDARGRLWVAAFGSGIRIVEPAVPGHPSVVHRVSVKEGLPDNSVDALLLDARGNGWASTDEGVARIDAADLSVTALGAADGLGLQAHWTNSAAKAPSGALIFGGTGGLTIVDPDKRVDWTFTAPIRVTDVHGGEPPVAVDAWNADTHPLTLAPQGRDLAVEFAALDYSAPASNRYAYRLDGFDKDWIATDAAHREARYTHLPPGDYVLELRGSNRRGAWSSPLRRAVHVPAAWYETTWFQAVLALLAIGLVAALVQARTFVLRERQRTLRLLVAERTAELERSSAELRQSELRLQQMAYHDGLTGLSNRRLFNDDFARKLAHARRGDRFALLLIDLDKFKDINDTHGHDAGDAVLMTVAGRLTQVLRDVDHVARLGGDEFAGLLTKIDQADRLDTICERILRDINRPIDHRGQTLCVGASIGVALSASQAETAEEMYKRADLALYEAKRAGRNGWHTADRQPVACV